MNLTPEWVPVRATDIAWQILEGEAVLVDARAKMMRGFNPVGTRIWELIDGQRNLRQIATALVAEFAESPSLEQVEQDVRQFAERLIQIRLLQGTEAH